MWNRITKKPIKINSTLLLNILLNYQMFCCFFSFISLKKQSLFVYIHSRLYSERNSENHLIFGASHQYCISVWWHCTQKNRMVNFDTACENCSNLPYMTLNLPFLLVLSPCDRYLNWSNCSRSLVHQSIFRHKSAYAKCSPLQLH